MLIGDVGAQSRAADQSRNQFDTGAWNLSSSEHGFLASTYLLNVRQGSDLSRQVAQLRGQGYETAEGHQVSFERWFSTHWTDLRILWITQIDQHSGIIWGASTGERGEKYKIEPGVTLGFIHQIRLFSRASLTLHGATVIGGRLKEKTCEADYGEIGGRQTTNCRLAASTLQPEQTLRYLLNEKPRQDSLMSIRFNWQF